MKKTFHQPKEPISLKNRPLFLLTFVLLICGLFLIADGTSIYSKSVYGDPYKFVVLQSIWILIGLVFFFIAYKVDYTKLGKASSVLLIINFVVLLILGICGLFNIDAPFAPTVNGANRWLYLNPPPLPRIPFVGIMGFQPSEMAKLTLVLFISYFLSKYVKEKFRYDPFHTFVAVVGAFCGLVLLQPNMSTTVMLGTICTLMYLASEFPLKKLFFLAPIVVSIAVAFILIFPHSRARVMTLLKGESSSDRTSGYHIRQVLISLGSGGLWGVGFGQSKQKYQYLPEIASDSIFALVGEEFGFFGTTTILLVFLYFIYRGILLAKRCTTSYERMLVVGITSWIGIQTFVNVAAMAKVIPLTGVPIPLISYGGSSMLFTLTGLGILANVEKNN